jgi:signal transduction histidine kinase
MSTARSFALRLTLLVTAVAALAVILITGVHIAMEVWRVRTQALEFVGAQARVIAANSTAALDFDDPEAASNTLDALAAVTDVAAAYIYKTGGDPATPFATFRRNDTDPLPRQTVPTTGIAGRWLSYAQPIVRDRQQIGVLTLVYDLAPIRRRLLLESGLAGAIACIVIALSFVAARRVQRALLRPVRELSAAAQAIARSDRYDIRARKVSDDELGALTDVFNGMIERIAEAEALRRNHRQMLEEEVGRRTTEVVDAQAKLRQAERMAALGTLSAGLGHDIGNILMPLMAHLASIRDTLGPDAGANRDVQAISRATEYLQKLSSTLRMLAQDPDRADMHGEPTSLPVWWAELEPILRAMVGKSIRIDAEFDTGLPRVKVTKALLMQAAFNLVQNAAQAFASLPQPAEHPRILVQARVRNGTPAGQRVAVSVTDNGPGMTEEVRRRCVEPYFTTKTRRISSGLGLSLVKGIAESAGGELAVDSRLGAGSTFTLILPAASNSAVEPKGYAVVSLKEPRRRAVITHMLRSLGCVVREGSQVVEDQQPGPRAARFWVTDSLAEVPTHWPDEVVLLAPPDAQASHGPRITVVDAATPLSDLRGVFRRLLPGARE